MNFGKFLRIYATLEGKVFRKNPESFPIKREKAFPRIYPVFDEILYLKANSWNTIARKKR